MKRVEGFADPKAGFSIINTLRLACPPLRQAEAARLPKCYAGPAAAGPAGVHCLYACGYSGAPPLPGSPASSFSGRVSKTLSTIPKAIASSASRKVSRSIAFSISVSDLPVYLA